MEASKTYLNAKKLIENDQYQYEEMKAMLDVFLLRKRITLPEYNELMDLMEAKKIAEAEKITE